MAEGIFLSYRRDDTRHVAGRLAGDLADRFGAQSIFRDVESIDGGEEFPVKLDRALSSCAMMLVLIGPKWLDITDEQGRRRLDNPDDWVRLEIAAALERGIRVVPVLVEDTPMPDASALPEDLRPLVNRQARLLSDMRWPGDLQAIVEMLSKVPGLEPLDAAPAGAATSAPRPVAPTPAPAGGKRYALIGAAAMLAVIVGLALWDDEPDTELALAQETADGAWPDLQGPWRTDSETSFYFDQDGPEIAITILEHDVEVGSGLGRLDGDVLNLTATFRDEFDQPFTGNCDLRASEDFRRFEGECLGPDGVAEPVYIRR